MTKRLRSLRSHVEGSRPEQSGPTLEPLTTWNLSLARLRKMFHRSSHPALLLRQPVAPSIVLACEQCGEEIGFERLDALPHARLCIKCKAKEEDGKRR